MNEMQMLLEAQMFDVISSNIAAIGWEKNILEVEFNSGSLYQYYRVPKSVFTQFYKAPSKGKYFWRRVRGKYRYKRMS